MCSEYVCPSVCLSVCRYHHFPPLAGGHGVHLLLCLLCDVAEGGPATWGVVVPAQSQ